MVAVDALYESFIVSRLFHDTFLVVVVVVVVVVVLVVVVVVRVVVVVVRVVVVLLFVLLSLLFSPSPLGHPLRYRWHRGRSYFAYGPILDGFEFS